MLKIDYAALARAKRTLNIKRDVKIKFLDKMDGIEGGYDWGIKIYPHILLIKKQKDVRHMNEVVWHELAHAAQCERVGIRKFEDAYIEQAKNIGLDWYEVKPPYSEIELDKVFNISFEIEAMDVEEIYGHRNILRQY